PAANELRPRLAARAAGAQRASSDRTRDRDSGTKLGADLRSQRLVVRVGAKLDECRAGANLHCQRFVNGDGAVEVVERLNVETRVRKHLRTIEIGSIGRQEIARPPIQELPVPFFSWGLFNAL